MDEATDLKHTLDFNLVEPHAGEIFAGHYRIGKELGSGGMGRVYLVTHTILDKPFALKIILPEKEFDDDDVQRFLNEAKTLHDLQHENVVRIFEFGITMDGKPYQILDFIDGSTLSPNSYDTPVQFTLSEKLLIARQIAEGLAHAHKHGVLHRDIKSSNIIVQRLPDGTPKASIIDFGIAKLKVHDGRTLTKTGEVVGSPAYVSPEQALGHQLDARSDIYSVGVVLYELFTGKLPFGGENPMVQIVARLNESPDMQPLQKGVPAPVRSIILRCLERNREFRYSTASELAQDLTSVIDGKRIAGRRVRWKGAVLPIAVACCVLIVGFMAMRTMLSFSAPSQSSGPPGGAQDVLNAAYDIDQKAYQYYVAGRFEDAIDMLKYGEQAADRRFKKAPSFANGWFQAENRMFIGQCHLGLKQYDKAEPYLAKSWEFFARKYPYNHQVVKNSADYYAKALTALGRAAEARNILDTFSKFGPPPPARS